jgi:beta-hydroxylase
MSSRWFWAAIVIIFLILLVKQQGPKLYGAFAHRYSKVSTTPFLPLKDFPQETAILKEHWKEIADEVAAIPPGELTKIKGDLFFRNIADDKWKKLYLRWYGDFDPVALKLCPRTCQILRGLPNIKSAMISRLEPGARILPHRGPLAGIVRLHLGLETPNDDACFIHVKGPVNGGKYSWRDGEIVLLDDTYEHYVQNNTDKSRTVLFCDIQRPMQQGFPERINTWVIENLGPVTSRANDKNKKAIKS